MSSIIPLVIGFLKNKVLLGIGGAFLTWFMASSDKVKVLIFALVLGLGFTGGYFYGKNTVDPVVIVQGTPTVENIQQAGNVGTSQAKEVVKEIAKVDKPSSVVYTKPADLVATVKKEEKKAGADFSILQDDTLALNQYNIKAYRKNLTTINYFPRPSNLNKVGAISFTHQVKVTKNGQYVGFSVERNFEFNRNYVGVSLTF